MRQLCRIIPVLFLILTAPAIVHAQEQPQQIDPKGPPDSFRVISYNVQFLPPIARHTNKRPRHLYRAEQIAEKMAAFDLVGLNETFDDEPRKIIHAHLRKKWGENCHIMFGPDPRDGRYNGGLSLISRYRFIKTDSTIYKNFSSPLKYGVQADGFAAKGVLYARLELPEKKFGSKKQLDVFVTHLEARDGSLRRKQFDELASFIKQKVSPDIDFILLGDLNTRGNIRYRHTPGSTYNQLWDVLTRAVPRHRLVDSWPTLHPDEDGGTKNQTEPTRGPRIDYIILGQTRDQCSQLSVEEVRVNPYLDEKVEALSDHSAVEATLRWKKESPQAKSGK